MTESKSRGRQRSSESEDAILTATLQLLKEKPLREITIEAICPQGRRRQNDHLQVVAEQVLWSL